MTIELRDLVGQLLRQHVARCVVSGDISDLVDLICHEVETHPTQRGNMRKTYGVEDYAAIIGGDAPIPNFEEMTPDAFCNALASTGHRMIPKWGRTKSVHGHKTWAFYFLANHSNMGDSPDGSGYVTIYGGAKPTVGRFAICKHEKKLGAGANPSRGWSPGACVKCGMDMTIDSGD